MIFEEEGQELKTLAQWSDDLQITRRALERALVRFKPEGRNAKGHSLFSKTTVEHALASGHGAKFS